MPHKHHNPSGTLASGRSIAWATASARTPDQSPDQSGVTAFWDLSQIITTDSDAERYLTLKQRHTPETWSHGAFEWAWEHSRATGIAREVILNLAWQLNGDTDFEPNDRWPGYLHLWLHTSDDIAPMDEGHHYTEEDLEPIADAVTELIALGELLLIKPGEDPGAVGLDEPYAPMFLGGPVDLSRACPHVGYVLPGYQKWLSREVAW
jgi:hypothetical protein